MAFAAILTGPSGSVNTAIGAVQTLVIQRNAAAEGEKGGRLPG